MEKRRIQFTGVEQAKCSACGREKPADALDRQLWCEECLERALRDAARWSRVIAVLAALALSVWIATAVQPAGRFLVAWAVVVLVAYRLIARVGRELSFSGLRIRRSRAPRR